MKILPPTPENIAYAADALRAGEVVAYPTETVYGLGVNPAHAAALDRLVAVKGRDAASPMLLIAGKLEHVNAVTALSHRAAAFADVFWPGPLSMLLPPARPLSPTLTGSDGRICVRLTSSPIAAALCDVFGGVVVSTSANRSGQPPAMCERDIPTEGVTLCLDAGRLPFAEPSTVLDPETGKLLREGAITREQIVRVLAGLTE